MIDRGGFIYVSLYSSISLHIYSTDLYRLSVEPPVCFIRASERTHESYLGNDQHSTFPWPEAEIHLSKEMCLVDSEFAFTSQMIQLTAVTRAKNDKLSPFWMTRHKDRHLTRHWHLFCDRNTIGSNTPVFFLKCYKRISAALKWQLNTRVLKLSCFYCYRALASTMKDVVSPDHYTMHKLVY